MKDAQTIEAILQRSRADYPFPVCGSQAWLTEVHPAVLADVRSVAEAAAESGLPELRARDILSFTRSGNRSDFEATHHLRRRELVCLAAALARDAAEPGIDNLCERGELIDRIQDRLWAVCEESSWILSAHLWNNGLSSELPPPDIHMIDLAAAQTALTLCEVLYLSEEYLHPEIVDRVDYELEQRVFRPYLYRNNFHWMTSYHNWNIVCHSSIAGAALYRGGSRYRSAILAKILQHAGRYIDGHDDQGSTPEGIMVWNYGFGHLCMLNDFLERWTGGELSMFRDQEEKIRQIASFPGKIHLSGEAFVNFSDCDRTTRLSPLIFAYLHRRLGFDLSLPPYTGLKEHDYILRLLFTPQDSNVPWMAAHPKVAYFEGNQWLVARSDTGRTPRVTIATKGGHNGESHNHNDLGAFIIHVGEQSLISDLGRDRFTRQTFAGDRYAGLAYSSRGHSVPRIQSVLQSPGESFHSRVLSFETGDIERIRYDLTQAYPPEAQCELFHRSFVYRRADDILEIHDEFCPRKEASALNVEEVYWSFSPIEVLSDNEFVVSGVDARLHGRFARPPEGLSVDKVTEAVQGQTAWCVRARYQVADAAVLSVTMSIQYPNEEHV